MAEDPHNTSDISETVELAHSSKEDAETTAARRELKQTSISEKSAKTEGQQLDDDDKSGSEEDEAASGSNDNNKRPERNAATPEAGAAAHNLAHDDEDLREHVSSPKKKRAHDELDEPKDVVELGAIGEKVADKTGNNGVAGSRTDRAEPEKKRARDQPEDGAGGSAQREAEPKPAAVSIKPSDRPKNKNVSPIAAPEAKKSKLQTSSTAFASSSFAKLASSSTSGFGALGAAGKSSIFGATSSSFGSLGSSGTTSAAPPKLTFGGGGTGPSPFASAAGLNGATKSSGFGGAFGGGGGGGGGGFGGTFGPRLTSFASQSKQSEVAKSDKPSKPFGAPDSDAEDNHGDGEEEEAAEEEAAEDAETEEREDDKEKEKDESKAAADEKRKPKLQKIVVDDGESQEVTILSVRTKMYQLDKTTSSWKERGGGMLKINVPKASVEIDDAGTVDPSSFDASILDADDGDEVKGRNCVRLVLRQDQTLRLLLNTTILPATKFQVIQKLKSSYVLFTAFDPDGVKQVQMKLSEANATLFTNTVELLQKELASI